VSRYKCTLKPVNDSGYTSCIGSRCGYPGLTILLIKINNRSESKNHDELINYTDRVSGAFFISF